jgi:hypothetical protein
MITDNQAALQEEETTMFINWNRFNGVFVATYAQAEGYAGDLPDLIGAVQNEGAAVSCPLEGAKDALCDGEFLAAVKADEETVEIIYNAILQAEDKA